ncbi:hypothetical protein STTU_p0026 (plasmid) [Streptomyces sp. Tu6071]|uniref:hypothetical protein n=1 Tax=Streptomyces sp. Tu6071 TaxID=355249 RepID=UPI00020E6A30|nr:hypothetical protein [Streptomyces sp. Tu6071]EGJ72639.1 hypothetical protein STTU_p0026 [Streptomyces sp. Tu6071]
MVDVAFTALYPWSLPPDKPRTDRAAARSERDLYAAHFRHARIARLPADCPPWALGQDLGWVVRSPVTATLTPLSDTDVAVPEDEDVRAVSRRAGGGQMWRRGPDWIAVPDQGGSWLRRYDFRNSSGQWEAMFLPNGQGTVEWHLGVAVRLPQPYFLMVLPLDPPLPGLHVPVGIIGAKTVNTMTDISIAIHPTHPVAVRREQPVARLVLLHPDTLRATSTTTPLTAAPPAPASSPPDPAGPAAPVAAPNTTILDAS